MTVTAHFDDRPSLAIEDPDPDRALLRLSLWVLDDTIAHLTDLTIA